LYVIVIDYYMLLPL